MPEPVPGPLAGIRVLEVAGRLGEYAGKLLADLGADVILVEPPAGGPTRHDGPFSGDDAGLERSLSHAYLHTSKRGITLDLESVDGQAAFRSLAATADVIIDSEPPGTMARRGLDRAALVDARPSLVVTCVTPFGLDGPYVDHLATDLILMALGGLLSLGGYSDTEPIRAHGDQACLAAGQFAAIGTMLAVLEAESSGEGQLVDVSAQESVVMAHENAIQFYDLEGTVRRRAGEDQRQAGVGVYPCQDGDIYLLAGGLGAFWDELVAWLDHEGIEDAEELREPRWKTLEFAASPEGKARFREIFGRLAMQRTKAELYAAAKRQRLPLCPISTPADLAESPQLLARDYFVSVKDGLPGRDLVMPGAPYRFAATPWAVSRPAPTLGQHDAEILGSIGLDADDRARLFAREAI